MEKIGVGVVGFGIFLVVGRVGIWSLIGGFFCVVDGVCFMYFFVFWWYFWFLFKMLWVNFLIKNVNCGLVDGVGNMVVILENGWFGGC